MCFPKILFPLFMLAFIFSLPLIFTLLAASISHFFTAAMKFSCFFSQRNSSPLSSITRTSSFSLLSTWKKRHDFVVLFLSKSPGGHAISFQIKPWVAFGFPYLLIELFYIGAPVVQAVRRSVGRTVTWLPKFLGCIGYQFSWPWCSATINSVQVINVKNTKQNAQVINVTDTK